MKEERFYDPHAARNACMHAWGSDLWNPESKDKYKRDSCGAVFGHEEIEDAWDYGRVS